MVSDIHERWKKNHFGFFWHILLTHPFDICLSFSDSFICFYCQGDQSHNLVIYARSSRQTTSTESFLCSWYDWATPCNAQLFSELLFAESESQWSRFTFSTFAHQRFSLALSGTVSHFHGTQCPWAQHGRWWLRSDVRLSDLGSTIEMHSTCIAHA